MRVKITALTELPAAIPFNYNYALHSAIYGLIEKSSGEYSRYLHDKGFINETVKKRFKLFTFSKHFFHDLWILAHRIRLKKSAFYLLYILCWV